MVLDDNGTGPIFHRLGPRRRAAPVATSTLTAPAWRCSISRSVLTTRAPAFATPAPARSLWKKPSVKAGDDGEGPGRGLALNIDPRHPGFESWVRGAEIHGMFNAKGEKISDKTPELLQLRCFLGRRSSQRAARPECNQQVELDRMRKPKRCSLPKGACPTTEQSPRRP